MKLRVLIADDEPLARERLHSLLNAEPDIEIVGLCENGRQTLKAAQRQRPDLVFLDVQMPEMDGFDFLKALPPESRPLIVIVTAFEKYAAQAFKIHAVDFLLKPFDCERLRATLRRARERICRSDQFETDELLKALRQVRNTPQGQADRIAIKGNGRIVFVPLAEIDWIEAAGNYCEIHAGGASHMLLSTLTALEDRLPGQEFARISRSAIINISHLKEVRLHHEQCTAVLTDGTEIAVSGSYRRTVDRLMCR